MIRLIRHHWHWRRKKFYRKSKWHLVLDFSLGILIVLLLAAVLVMHYYKPDLSALLSFNFSRAEKINLNQPPLELSASLAKHSFAVDESVPLTISLKNSYSRDIKNIRLKLKVASPFSLSKLEDSANNAGVKIEKNELKLKYLKAGKSKTLKLEAYLRSSSGDRIVKWEIEGEYVVSGQVIKDNFVLDRVSLISDPAVSSVVYYNSPQGDQLGAGPLPPIAYLPTNYWVFWSVKANGDLKDFVMSAKLAPGVELTDNQSLLAGKLNYNPSSRRIIWKIEKVETKSDSYRVGFEIQLIPEEDQVGKILNLISGIKYYAYDEISGQEVSEQIGALNTNLDFDRLNRGQGKVLAQ